MGITCPGWTGIASTQSFPHDRRGREESAAIMRPMQVRVEIGTSCVGASRRRLKEAPDGSLA
jgi:hypothetical protein